MLLTVMALRPQRNRLPRKQQQPWRNRHAHMLVVTPPTSAEKTVRALIVKPAEDRVPARPKLRAAHAWAVTPPASVEKTVRVLIVKLARDHVPARPKPRAARAWAVTPLVSAVKTARVPTAKLGRDHVPVRLLASRSFNALCVPVR